MFQPMRASAGKPQHPKLRRAASHAVINAGLRKLRPKRSNVEPLCPASLASAQTISRYAVNSSPSASPPAVLPRPAMSPASAQVPDSGPLPTYLAQLRGIHYVGDPNQDPDLDEDTMSNILPLSSSRDSITSSSTPSDGVRSSTDTNGMDSDASSAADPSVHIELFPAPRPTRRLTPRSCKAAFPPIDLESPYAPYAPTPPLSPPAIPGLNDGTHKTHPFHLPKTLRKLPSTASIFRKAKPFGQPALQVPSHSSVALSLHDQSSDSVRTHSKGPSLETENDSRPSGGSGTREECCVMSSRTGSRSSSCHSVTSAPAYKTFRRKLGLGSVGHPLQRSETHDTLSSAQPALRPDLDRTINSKTKGLNSLFAVPISRMRTYSSLSGLFKSSKPDLAAVPSHPSPNAAASEVQANISALLSTDTGFEILASDATKQPS
eukprot:GHVU01166544.1.p1 GENE.GHVU01166544.1~~GHVU01166544.1.p1  ORF type:complete len:434 (-),score=8.60 GHVU01166544.1:366-1667(-)